MCHDTKTEHEGPAPRLVLCEHLRGPNGDGRLGHAVPPKKLSPPISEGEAGNPPVAHDSGAGHNPIDLAALRLSQDYVASAGVCKLLVTVPVRKPTKQEFIRTHSDESYRFDTKILVLKAKNEFFLVAPDLWDYLADELQATLIVTTINRQGSVFLWPVRLPNSDGREDRWSASALAAADVAETRWLRMKADMSLGSYEISAAVATLPEPQWPVETLESLVTIAFKDHYIQEYDHPVLRRLRGEL